MRFEGHHLSLNLTLTGKDVIAVTPFLLGANPKFLPEGTVDPLLPFLNAHENEPAFLLEYGKMFRSDAVRAALRDASVEPSGFGVFRHPHMEVSGPLDFGGQ